MPGGHWRKNNQHYSEQYTRIQKFGFHNGLDTKELGHKNTANRLSHISLAQRVEGLKDLVVKEILHTRPCLSRLVFPLLLDQNVQHLFQVRGDVGVCNWSLVI